MEPKVAKIKLKIYYWFNQSYEIILKIVIIFLMIIKQIQFHWDLKLKNIDDEFNYYK